MGGSGSGPLLGLAPDADGPDLVVSMMGEVGATASDGEDDARGTEPADAAQADAANISGQANAAGESAEAAVAHGAADASGQAPVPKADAAAESRVRESASPGEDLLAREEPGQGGAQEDDGAEPDRSVALAEAGQPKKKGFLAMFFSQPSSGDVPSPVRNETRSEPVSEQPKEEPVEAAPTIAVKARSEAIRKASFTGDALPGVRKTSLFEISRRSGLDDDSDIDLHEGADGSYQVASAAGLARLAPNGLLTQRQDVDVACLKPELVRILKTAERHFGKRLVVTSGYRSPAHNKRVRGARRSMHMHCAAADVQMAGVSKWELARFVRALPGRGGVGTYCHTKSVHIDVGPERDWNWRCRRK